MAGDEPELSTGEGQAQSGRAQENAPAPPAVSFDPVVFLQQQITQLQGQLKEVRADLREKQREASDLKAQKAQAVHGAKAEARSQANREINRLRDELQEAREELRSTKDQLWRTEHEQRLEKKFEQKYGPAESSKFDRIMELAEEHGPTFVQKCIEVILQQAGGNAGNVPDQKAIRAALQQAQQRPSGAQQQAQPQHPQAPQQQFQQAPQQQARAQEAAAQPSPQQEQPPSMPQERSPQLTAQPYMPTATENGAPARDAGQVTEARDASQSEAPAADEHAATATPGERFVDDISTLALVGLEDGTLPDEFAGEARQVIAQLQSEGFEYSTEAFAQLCEELAPACARRAIDPVRVARYLVPFAEDMGTMTVRAIKTMPAGQIMKLFIEPTGIELDGHGDYLLSGLRAVKAEL